MTQIEETKEEIILPKENPTEKLEDGRYALVYTLDGKKMLCIDAIDTQTANLEAPFDHIKPKPTNSQIFKITETFEGNSYHIKSIHHKKTHLDVNENNSIIFSPKKKEFTIKIFDCPFSKIKDENSYLLKIYYNNELIHPSEYIIGVYYAELPDSDEDSQDEEENTNRKSRVINLKFLYDFMGWTCNRLKLVKGSDGKKKE